MKEEKIKEKTTNKVRTSLVRKQNVIFVAMVIVGLSLTIMSQFADSRLLSEGIAFIIVGFVGMLMSWTTMDIGASIKEAIYDVGRQHANALESMAKSQEKTSESLEEIKDILDTHTKILDTHTKILDVHTDILQNDIAKSQKEIKDILQNDIASSQKEIKDILNTHTDILQNDIASSQKETSESLDEIKDILQNKD